MLFYVVVTILSLHLPFFSDGIVQSSIAAQWFFDNDFRYFFIPEDRNPGHPPFWGMYLAGWWKIFGQSLGVSHVAMLPFLLGIAWNYFLVARFFMKDALLVFAMVLLALEPTLLAMSTQVTPDIPLVFFFFLSVRSMLYERNGLQALAMGVMPLLNTRGTMLVAVIFLSELMIIWLLKDRKPRLKAIWKYVLVGLVVLAWLGAHYFEKGWIGYNRAEMPWAAAFEPVNFKGIIRNWAVLGWRFLDFGRVALWLVALFICMKMLREKSKFDKHLMLLIGFAAAQVLVFGPVITRYIATLQHRYMIPAFLLFSLAIVYGLKIFQKRSARNLCFSFIVVSLLAGHFWIYPDKISQGWEASLAHVSYFKAREQINVYIEAQGINPDSVTAGTPLKYRYMDTNLKAVDWKMVDHDEVDVTKYPYALYSNISNDWPDETYDMLHKNWELVVEQNTGGIVVRLFRNPAKF